MSDSLKDWVESQAFITDTKRKFSGLPENEQKECLDYVQKYCAAVRSKDIIEIKKYNPNQNDKFYEDILEKSEMVATNLENFFTNIITHKEPIESHDEEKNDAIESEISRLLHDAIFN